ncbi:endothelin-3 isoform X2 [Mugil cephalus]|nr:endothelin-3 isoform X2 [Mugil cephalus]
MANASYVDVGVLFLIVVAASLANGSSSSKDVRHVDAGKLSAPLPGGWNRFPAVAPSGEESPARRRAKRCTCYSYKDKECVYYCHLDIIWINTPEHTVPYGMSNYQGSLRMRRSTETERGKRGAEGQRCVCSLQVDSGCSSFCVNRRQRRTPRRRPKTGERTQSLLSGPVMK